MKTTNRIDLMMIPNADGSMHLYRISNAKVQKGDWCLHQIQHDYTLVQAPEDDALLHYKIEDTTNTLLDNVIATDGHGRETCFEQIPQMPKLYVNAVKASINDYLRRKG